MLLFTTDGTSYRGADKSLARTRRKQANVSVRMAWISFGALPCRKKKTWLQLASRCCWNRARPWHASELVTFLIGLRTYQHSGKNGPLRPSRILCQWKIPVTPAGIEPATFRFVAQHLNHCATAVLVQYNELSMVSSMYNVVSLVLLLKCSTYKLYANVESYKKIQTSCWSIRDSCTLLLKDCLVP